VKKLILLSAIVLMGCERPNAVVAVTELSGGRLHIEVTLSGAPACVDRIQIVRKNRRAQANGFYSRDWELERAPSAGCRSAFDFPSSANGYVFRGPGSEATRLQSNEEYHVEVSGSGFDGESATFHVL